MYNIDDQCKIFEEQIKRDQGQQSESNIVRDEPIAIVLLPKEDLQEILCVFILIYALKPIMSSSFCSAPWEENITGRKYYFFFWDQVIIFCQWANIQVYGTEMELWYLPEDSKWTW